MSIDMGTVLGRDMGRHLSTHIFTAHAFSERHPLLLTMHLVNATHIDCPCIDSTKRNYSGNKDTHPPCLVFEQDKDCKRQGFDIYLHLFCLYRFPGHQPGLGNGHG